MFEVKAKNSKKISKDMNHLVYTTTKQKIYGIKANL